MTARNMILYIAMFLVAFSSFHMVDAAKLKMFSWFQGSQARGDAPSAEFMESRRQQQARIHETQVAEKAKSQVEGYKLEAKELRRKIEDQDAMHKKLAEQMAEQEKESILQKEENIRQKAAFTIQNETRNRRNRKQIDTLAGVVAHQKAEHEEALRRERSEYVTKIQSLHEEYGKEKAAITIQHEWRFTKQMEQFEGKVQEEKRINKNQETNVKWAWLHRRVKWATVCIATVLLITLVLILVFYRQGATTSSNSTINNTTTVEPNDLEAGIPIVDTDTAPVVDNSEVITAEVVDPAPTEVVDPAPTSGSSGLVEVDASSRLRDYQYDQYDSNRHDYGSGWNNRGWNNNSVPENSWSNWSQSESQRNKAGSQWEFSL